MKSAKILTIFTIVLAFVFQVSGQDEKPKIFWKNVSPRYKKFSEINPILVNQSDKSIYLYKLHPYWNAHLQRFNEEIKQWETGGKGIGCGTIANPLEPIEIKPSEERQIELAWELSTDNFEKPKFFELQDRETLRPLIGKYRLYLSYAFEPWTLKDTPLKKYVVSTEFEIVNKR
ncbi:MAG: hypothetical protein K1X72_29065 [Pyrinomonadaceae bacterium]|nr:hypothetical protein [Pyrinomonadaceae bacterium]